MRPDPKEMRGQFMKPLTEQQQVEAVQKRAMAMHIAIVGLINSGATDMQLLRMLPGYRNGEWWREHAPLCTCEQGML